MFLKSFFQANLNQRMITLNDEIKIIFLREMNIDYDHFVNQIFFITKKDNIYFDYIKEDYIKYINKIINDRIDSNLIYFNDTKLLECMVKYLSDLCEFYLNKIRSDFITIMHKYISENLKDKIKEFDTLNMNKIDKINNSILNINNKYKFINNNKCNINTNHNNINIEIYNLKNYTHNLIYNFIENHIFNNIKNYNIENDKYKNIKKTNNISGKYKYYLHNHKYKYIMKNYKYKNKHENILKKKSSKYKKKCKIFYLKSSLIEE